MIKKILHLCSIAILIPFHTLAISLNELQSNPERYAIASKDVSLSTTCYTDLRTIKVLRYSPPYLTLQAKLYLVSYDRNTILENLAIFHYDTTRSFTALSLNQLKLSGLQGSPDLTQNDGRKILATVTEEAKENSGIAINTFPLKNVYSLDGTFKNSFQTQAENSRPTMTIYDSNGYRIGVFIYGVIYSPPFWIYEENNPQFKQWNESIKR